MEVAFSSSLVLFCLIISHQRNECEEISATSGELPLPGFLLDAIVRSSQVPAYADFIKSYDTQEELVLCLLVVEVSLIPQFFHGSSAQQFQEAESEIASH